MKIHNIKYLLIAVFMLIFSACDPIVDEKHLSDSTDVAGVELVATQSPPGGNKITLSMNTPGVTGYWDYGLDKALTNEVTIVYPIPGKSTFTFVGTLGVTFFTKTIDVQIDRIDTRLDQDWYDLVSENTTVGKTWVFDGVGGDGGLWWYMSPDIANGGKDKWDVPWWNAGGSGDKVPVDVDGKMHFDLDKDANYKHYETKTATPTIGKFKLDIKNKLLTIFNSKMLGYEAGNADGIYEVIELTETRLVLHLSNSDANKTGWTFIFKPE